MLMNQGKTRGVAVLTGGVIAASALLPGLFMAAPAQAADSKTYKAGAIVLGAASAYLLIKGKTLPGVLAGAGAYYAYKKSKDNNSDRYGQYPDQYPGDRYGQNGDVYPGDNGASYPRDPGYGEQYPDYEYGALAPTAPRTSKKALKSGSNLRTRLK
jgi:hypothetical protein